LLVASISFSHRLRRSIWRCLSCSLRRLANEDRYLSRWSSLSLCLFFGGQLLLLSSSSSIWPAAVNPFVGSPTSLHKRSALFFCCSSFFFLPFCFGYVYFNFQTCRLLQRSTRVASLLATRCSLSLFSFDMHTWRLRRQDLYLLFSRSSSSHDHKCLDLNMWIFDFFFFFFFLFFFFF
jgi:hypothetical protein